MDEDSFKLAPSVSYFSKLKPEDRRDLRLYVRRQGSLVGDALLRKTYLEYPQYSARSEIATKILSPDEYLKVKEQWSSESKNVLMSIGYEGVSIDQYIAQLIFSNVTLLVDVRQNPYSRKHGFSQKQFKNYIQKAGIRYEHRPQLGIPSSLRRHLDTPNDYTILFDHYAAHILPNEHKSVSEIMEWVLTGERVALTCFEAEHSMCHRHKITDVIAKDQKCSFPIIHL